MGGGNVIKRHTLWRIHIAIRNTRDYATTRKVKSLGKIEKKFPVLVNYSSVTRLAEDCLYSKLQAEVVESLVLEYTSIIDYLVEETFKIKKGTIEEGKGSARV